MPRSQTLLFVEGAESDLILMRKAIAKGGLSIELKNVEDSAEAIRYFKGEGDYADRSKHPIPTLLLLNLKMPRMDEFQVLDWLRQQSNLKAVFVIVLTDSNHQAEVARPDDLGVNAVLIKPTNLDECAHMLEQVSIWLDLKRQPPIVPRESKPL